MLLQILCSAHVHDCPADLQEYHLKIRSQFPILPRSLKGNDASHSMDWIPIGYS